jgi:hypothetical protein
MSSLDLVLTFDTNYFSATRSLETNERWRMRGEVIEPRQLMSDEGESPSLPVVE